MDRKERERLISLYRDGYRAIVDALHGATEEELDARPADGRWSAREIVHHLADSEMMAAIRLRMLLAEERAQIRSYDQDVFARKLHYDSPHESSLMAFRYARECTAQLMDRMTEEEWVREGTHSDIGTYSVEKWLEIYAPHAHSHARQIVEVLGLAKKNQ